MDVNFHSGAVTSGTTSAQLAALADANSIESLTIYTSSGDVTIFFSDTRSASVTEEMNGHTFVASNGSKFIALEDFTIQTDCHAAWTAF